MSVVPEDVWESHHQLIETLYLHENKTLMDVVESLRDLPGFGHATQRMVRTRLDRWGLTRKYKRHPTARDFSERSSKRREAQHSGASHTLMLPLRQRAYPNNSPELLSPGVNDPVQEFYDRAVYTMQVYSYGYLESGLSKNFVEPLVHRDTTHGKFAHAMQESVSVIQYDLRSASRAFIILEDLLKDPHLISLAILLVVICDIKRRDGSTQLVSMLIRQSIEYLKLLRTTHPGHPWIPLFEALGKTPDASLLDLSLRCTRVARDIISKTLGRMNWQTLYLEERLCDGLYYAGIDGERIRTRRILFEDQQRYYGPFARNVLWTLNNVAEDKLQIGQFQQAEELYQMGLERALDMPGFHGVKTRFGPLEGLANTQMAKVGLVKERFESWNFVRPIVVEDEHAVEMALHYLEKAGEEASLFPQPSRRMQRIQEKKSALLKHNLESLRSLQNLEFAF